MQRLQRSNTGRRNAPWIHLGCNPVGGLSYCDDIIAASAGIRYRLS